MKSRGRRPHGGGDGFAITSSKENAMPNPNMTSPTGSGPLLDTQQLITLLSNLMPLLQRMQAQIGPSSFSPMSPAPLSPDQFALGQGNLAALNPLIDQQAAVSFVEDITADSLRNLSIYLELHAEKHQELAPCVAIVTQAARSFSMRDYSQAFGLIWQAYRVIAAARSVNPQLPPLRAAGQGGFASPPPSTH
jgi:hypothetical protein